MNHPTAPALDSDEANYATCQVTALMPIAANDFFDWYMAEPIENFMLGTLFVPPITGVELVGCDNFLEPDALRLITFRDGTIAWEKLLSTDFPHSYSYMPYAYTNPMRLFSDHAKATMTAVPEGGQARIVWDYAFHARNRAVLPIVKLFVALDWKRNLANGLAVIRNHLAEHGAQKRIHEAAAFDRAA